MVTSSRIARVALAAALSLTVLTACTPTSESTDDPTSPDPTTTEATSPDRPDVAIPDVQPEGFVDAPGGGFAGYESQEIDWASCEVLEQFDCATVAAPLDYDDPDRQALTLHLMRANATEEPKLGTLFVNPGGPGAPGSDLVISLKKDGLEQFDIIGMDPRGTGKSTPVQCWQGAEMDSFLDTDASPDDDAELQALIEAGRDFGQSCLDESGELLQHVTTQNTARDLDLLRGLVGDEKLFYLGFSYGTELGATYAEMFPDKVGRLVLDAAVNITDDETVIQAQGFDRAFTNFANWCLEQRTCGLGENVDEITASLRGVLDDLDQNPIPAGDRMVTQSQGVTGVVVTLYAEETWEYLRQALVGAQNGDARLLLLLADAYNGRSPDGTFSSLHHAFPAIRCVDNPDEGIDAAIADAEEQTEKAPIFGPYFGPGTVCATWPVAAIEPLENITATGADPILVVGTTGDSATPYEFAVSMADQLESGVLLTLDGEGHGAYGGNSECIDEAVVKYLVTGEAPAHETVCQPN